MLTLTGNVLEWWKEYFKDLLNSTVMSFAEVAGAQDSGNDLSITRAELSEIVGKLLGVRTLGVDEVLPEYLKSLEERGLSKLTCLCNIAWQLVGDNAYGPADMG